MQQVPHQFTERVLAQLTWPAGQQLITAPLQEGLSDVGTLAHRLSGLLAEIAYHAAIFRNALAAGDPHHLAMLCPIVFQVERPQRHSSAGSAAAGADGADVQPAAGGDGVRAQARAEGTQAAGGAEGAAEPVQVGAPAAAGTAQDVADAGSGDGAAAAPEAAADQQAQAGAAATDPRQPSTMLDHISLNPDLTPLLAGSMGMGPMLMAQGGMPGLMPPMGVLTSAMPGAAGQGGGTPVRGGSEQVPAMVRSFGAHCSALAQRYDCWQDAAI